MDRHGVNTGRLRVWLPWLLLTAAFLLGCTTLYAYSFTDEGGALWKALLISRGQVLYRDINSHHFPFQDYWGGAAIALLGKSILAVRLSVWVFQIGSFAVAMLASRMTLPLSMAALVWSIVRHLYSGNMLLYPSFAGAALLVVFTIVIAVLLRKIEADWRRSLVIGLFSTVAILSDPLSAYAVGLALLFLFLAAPKQGFLAALFTGAGLLVYLAALAATGSLRPFLDDAILFNAEVRPKYQTQGPLRLEPLLVKMVTGLGIADSRWLNLNPFKAVTYAPELDSWIFTGFLFRLAILAGTLFLLAQKSYRAATFLYLFAAATLLNRESGFRAAGFVLVALVTACAIVTGEWWKSAGKVTTRLRLASGAAIGLMLVWLGLRVVVYNYIQDPAILSYETHFGRHEAMAAEIEEMACGQPDVLLGRYPAPGYAHWFTEMQPVAGYWLLYPWAAEVALDEVLSTLKDADVKAVVIVRERELAGINTTDYLRSLYEYVDAEYVRIADSTYLSPALAARCHE